MVLQLSDGTVPGTAKDLTFLKDIVTVFKEWFISFSGTEVKTKVFDVVISLESRCSLESLRKGERCRVLTSKVIAQITSVAPAAYREK